MEGGKGEKNIET